MATKSVADKGFGALPPPVREALIAAAEFAYQARALVRAANNHLQGLQCYGNNNHDGEVSLEVSRTLEVTSERVDMLLETIDTGAVERELLEWRASHVAA